MINEFTQFLSKIHHPNFNVKSFNYRSIKAENYDNIAQCLKEETTDKPVMFEIFQEIKKVHPQFPKALEEKLNDEIFTFSDLNKYMEFGLSIKHLFNQKIIDCTQMDNILFKLLKIKSYVKIATLFVEIYNRYLELDEESGIFYVDVLHLIIIEKKPVERELLKSCERVLEEFNKDLKVVGVTKDIKPSLKKIVNNIIIEKKFSVSFYLF